MIQKTAFIFIIVLSIACKGIDTNKKEKTIMKDTNTNLSYATFGGGCFWCTEAMFEQLRGVKKVLPGYSGGQTKNPNYKEVCTGTTGHAEVIHITYDANEVSFETLLEVFFATHNPTTLNRQGADAGTQYRSVVFYHDDAQKEATQNFINALDLASVYDAPIVTELSPFDTFYKAENYHQNYYENNKEQAYCRAVIDPKLKKFLVKFSDKLK